jgi:Fe2+ transport system protein FeoA
MEVTLKDLKQGEKGKILAIRGGCGIHKRLLDMGITPGTIVSVVGAAPLKGPVMIKVRGSKLAIGMGIASKVLVEIVSGGHDSV